MAQKVTKKASQAWLMTFTDMLMLLVVMFVLFLSFSEVDSDSFKQNAGPIAEAFNQPPPTSILPGNSAIIPLSTTNIEAKKPGQDLPEETLEVDAPANPGANINPIAKVSSPTKQNSEIGSINEEINPDSDTVTRDKNDKTEKLSDNLKEIMKEELRDGKFELLAEKNIVTLRFPEKVTFSSGEADLRQEIEPVLDQIVNIISNTTLKDKIIVTGHSDSIPISTYRYRSNWDLSAARAVSVVHHLLKTKKIDKNRILAAGSADTRPIAKNDTLENRSLNRRVEIRIEMSESK